MRHAIYFAPDPRSQLHDLGSRWLGRDAFTGEPQIQPAMPGLDAITAEPRRYGFHATLKPPFALRDGTSPEALMAAIPSLAASIPAFSVALKVDQLDGFLALVPASPAPQLDALAERCVRDLDVFRAEPGAAELQRRRKASLSPRQDTNLVRWGYPYVLEDFRFHMTLSRRLAPDESTAVAEAARSHFAPALAEPVTISSLTLFREQGPGAAFDAIQTFHLLPPTPET